MSAPNAPTTGLRVVVVEDEPPARRRMRSLLQHHDDVTIVGEAAHGGEALDMIRRERPDVVLLDVELPVANGFEVIDAIGVSEMPDVIFVTAYDDYAIRAFEVHALDYLLKPVEHERLAAALDRARARLAPRRPDTSALGRAMGELRQLPSFRRIPVRHGDRILFVDIADIDCVTAEGNYVRVRARGATYLVRETLNAFEAKLRPHGFLRIQRSTLVQSDRIVELQPLFHGEYVVKLKDGTKVRLQLRGERTQSRFGQLGVAEPGVRRVMHGVGGGGEQPVEEDVVHRARDEHVGHGRHDAIPPDDTVQRDDGDRAKDHDA